MPRAIRASPSTSTSVTPSAQLPSPRVGLCFTALRRRYAERCTTCRLCIFVGKRRDLASLVRVPTSADVHKTQKGLASLGLSHRLEPFLDGGLRRSWTGSPVTRIVDRAFGFPTVLPALLGEVVPSRLKAVAVDDGRVLDTVLLVSSARMHSHGACLHGVQYWHRRGSRAGACGMALRSLAGGQRLKAPARACTGMCRPAEFGVCQDDMLASPPK
mmetsp:Transcript_110631/g.356889  ORF Transcript_110631/g.356889 Transcript_110631/m.356889 type:complete len:215 (+) Transcript_110631:571-1215(+)